MGGKAARAGLTRRGWLVLVVLPALLLLGVAAWRLRPRWVVVDQRGGVTTWRRGDILHTDRNGDGIVDEIAPLGESPERVSCKRDLDLDGWFDIAYELGPHGVAVNVRPIRERAPRRR